MLSYSYQLADRVGGRTEQQDAAGAVVTRYGLLVLVCDGMGGARGGSTASRLAVDLIQRGVQESTEADGAAALLQAIQRANREIYRRSQQDEGLRGMGTTLTVLLLQETHATLAHAGDSRIYQLRKGKVVFRTTDHSKVFELVKRGILSEEQARLSEDSNVILRALGIKPDLDVEVHDHQPYQTGDRYLLCTDGVSGLVPEDTFLNWLTTPEPVEQLVPAFVQQVDDYGFHSGGGHDNLTAALVECRSAPGSAVKKGGGWFGNRAAGWVFPLGFLLLLGYLLYGQLVQTPRRAGENRALVAENNRLRRSNRAMTAERDSLRGLLNHPLVQQAVRQVVRRRPPDAAADQPTLTPGLKAPKSPLKLPRADSGVKPPPTARPGALASPAPVPTENPL